MHVDNRYSV